MALSEFELRKIKKHIGTLCSKRSRSEGLNRCDITYRVLDNEVWMFERRPRWDNPHEWNEFAFARARCDMDSRMWTLLWQDQNLKWHETGSLQPTRNFEKLIDHIDEDRSTLFLS